MKKISPILGTILIFVLALVLFGGAFVYQHSLPNLLKLFPANQPNPITTKMTFNQNLSSSNCQIWHDNIEQAFVNDNYCSKDSDCQAIPLGGKLVEFGCIHYLNNSVSKDTVYSILYDYTRKCTNIIDDCDYNEATICADNKCVDDYRYEQYLQYKSHSPSEQLMTFESCYVNCAQSNFEDFKSCVKEDMCDQILDLLIR
jgi:hypothetical protein